MSGTEYALGQPDFVLMGFPHQGGFAVVAANDLDEASVKAVYTDPASYTWGPITYHEQLGIKHVSFQARTNRHADPHFVMVWGETYAEAMRNLMAFWQPSPGREQAGLPAASRELSGG